MLALDFIPHAALYTFFSLRTIFIYMYGAVCRVKLLLHSQDNRILLIGQYHGLFYWFDTIWNILKADYRLLENKESPQLQR